LVRVRYRGVFQFGLDTCSEAFSGQFFEIGAVENPGTVPERMQGRDFASLYRDPERPWRDTHKRGRVTEVEPGLGSRPLGCRRNRSASPNRPFSRRPHGRAPPAQPKDATRTQPARRRPPQYCGSSVVEFYNPRRRHSSIEYLSPIDYEHGIRRRRPAIPTHTSLPSCGPGRKNGSAGGRTKESLETGGQDAVRPNSLIASSHHSTKPGQVQASGNLTLAEPTKTKSSV
jgi:hypothetical protein